MSSTSTGGKRPVILGGVDFAPGLIKLNNADLSQNESKTDNQQDNRGALDKQREIVEYLKRLPSDSKVFIHFSFV